MYNNTWFSNSVSTAFPPVFDYTDINHTAPVATIPAASAILIVTDNVDPPNLFNTGPDLHAAILASPDRLFFISYLPIGTLRPLWYLIQVDLDQSALDHATSRYIDSGIYYCHFFGKHPDALSLPDITGRFWPLWHRFSTGRDGIIDYGPRVLFPPPTVPDPTLYIAWADTVTLLNPALALLGPFCFSNPATACCSRIPSLRQVVPAALWSQLASLCNDHGIQSPTLSCPPTRSLWSKIR